MNILRTLVFSLLLCATAFAQSLVTVSCDAYSQPTITYTDATGRAHTDTWPDTNGDGKVEFSVPAGVTEVTVTKETDGRWITYKITLEV
ncbi:MAG TPA: hypothetical protein VK348_15215 [Planctomycetota bacterium]|nr:hypothetical protein [Planctomycetota bacterium]